MSAREFDIEAALTKMPGSQIEEFMRTSARELNKRADTAILSVMDVYMELKLDGEVLRPEEGVGVVRIQCTVKDWKTASAIALIGTKELEHAAVTKHCTMNEGEEGIHVIQSFRVNPKCLKFLSTDMLEEEGPVTVADCLTIMKGDDKGEDK